MRTLSTFPVFFVSFIVLALCLSSGGCTVDPSVARHALDSAGIENITLQDRSFFAGCPENHGYNIGFHGSRTNSRNQLIPVSGTVCCTTFDACIVVYE